MCWFEYAWWHCPSCKGPTYDPNSRPSYEEVAREVHCSDASCPFKCGPDCCFENDLAVPHFHGGEPPTVVKRYFLLCAVCELRQSPEWADLNPSEKWGLSTPMGCGRLTEYGKRTLGRWLLEKRVAENLRRREAQKERQKKAGERIVRFWYGGPKRIRWSSDDETTSGEAGGRMVLD